nr:TIGR03905 family TSCPD domain-containing protein [uncultured Desulfuromonas sp.]
MTYQFKPSGCCAKLMKITIAEDTISEVEIVGGCRGNTAGIERLIRNQKIEDVAQTLRGIACRGTTSCPDQLAIALEQILAERNAA